MIAVDTSWYRDVNDFARHTGWLHSVMAAYALWAGLAVLVVLLVGGWLWARRRPDAPRAVATATLTGVAAVVAVLANQHLISPAIGRSRPCHTLHHTEVLLTCANDYSMPSDHCIIAGALVAGMWILHRRLGVVAGVLGLLLAFGRVYTGVHYPSDTIVGLLLGAVIGAMIVLGLRRPAMGVMTWLAHTRARALVCARTVPRPEQPAPARAG